MGGGGVGRGVGGRIGGGGVGWVGVVGGGVGRVWVVGCEGVVGGVIRLSF